MALLVMRMPFPDVPEVIRPALTTAPPIELLLMVMPVRVGAALPVPVITPVEVLVTSLVTVIPVMSMQLMLAELLTAVWLVVGAIAHAANAAGVPAPISSAASEVEARSGPSLARPTLRATARAGGPPARCPADPLPYPLPIMAR
jgi:hypothetical protein